MPKEFKLSLLFIIAVAILEIIYLIIKGIWNKKHGQRRDKILTEYQRVTGNKVDNQYLLKLLKFGLIKSSAYLYVTPTALRIIYYDQNGYKSSYIVSSNDVQSYKILYRTYQSSPSGDLLRSMVIKLRVKDGSLIAVQRPSRINKSLQQRLLECTGQRAKKTRVI